MACDILHTHRSLPCRPPISALGDSVFRVLVVLKICSKIVRTYDVGAPSTIKISLPGTDPVDAERRKLDNRQKQPQTYCYCLFQTKSSTCTWWEAGEDWSSHYLANNGWQSQHYFSLLLPSTSPSTLTIRFTYWGKGWDCSSACQHRHRCYWK